MTTPLAEADPLSQVHAALWSLLESDPAWCTLVKAGNRIKFTGDGASPRKTEQLAESDRPEVQIRAAAVAPSLNVDSANTRVVARFEIQIASGAQGFDVGVFPALWQTLRALHGYRDALVRLEWNGAEFVKRVQATQADIGVGRGDADRGALWWTALWGCEVEMWFPAILMQSTR